MKKTDVPLVLDAFGSVQAAASVSIRSQVGEILKVVHFKEGEKVAAGELLFTIESKPFDVALQKANAILARDRVEASNAGKEADRARELVDQHLTAQSDADKAIAAGAALAQTVKADEAAVAVLQLDVDHCRILSPIAGRAGKVMIDAGNLVEANGAPLVVIRQISPIKVSFSVPQAELDRVRVFRAGSPVAVEATLSDDPGHPESGVLDFIDNSVDASTGTIRLGATFTNANERLWPGRYVRVRVLLSVQKDAIVVSGRAVVEGGTEGQYVFVVKDGKAELRTVKVSRTSGDDDVIESGVKPGEIVVIDGQSQLEDGTKVEVIPAATPEAGK